jgi:NADH dehydrogenase (ubiquinone) 1 beta subcomplex subunit 8
MRCWSDYNMDSWLILQNGGYINPTNDPYPLKRQFRDPYHPWWDKQERRDFGEPVHEDNDILGMFSLHEYTHMSPARALLLWGGFISAILGLSYVIKQYYPDKPSAPKEYPDGLETELGGPHALRVSNQPTKGKTLLIAPSQAWKDGDKL